MSDIAGKYKVSNYPFFTGSLGNWAGNERKIPTYTLELPNSDWNKTDQYFKMFRGAIHHAIQNDLTASKEKKKVSQNSSEIND
jgi:protein MpaA